MIEKKIVIAKDIHSHNWYLFYWFKFIFSII